MPRSLDADLRFGDLRQTVPCQVRLEAADTPTRSQEGVDIFWEPRDGWVSEEGLLNGGIPVWTRERRWRRESQEAAERMFWMPLRSRARSFPLPEGTENLRCCRPFP